MQNNMLFMLYHSLTKTRLSNLSYGTNVHFSAFWRQSGSEAFFSFPKKLSDDEDLKLNFFFASLLGPHDILLTS